MKKSSLIKGILLILLSVVLMGTNGVYAASTDTDSEIDDLMNFSSSSSNTTNTANNQVNTAANNVANNANTSKNNANVSKNSTNTANSSVYNNTNSSLPKTGVEDSIPTMVLIVVFAISAVYAFKKIKEYNV